MDTTVAAISTALGVGSISIIRVSGPKSIEIVSKIFKGKNLKKVKSHTINYGYIVENTVIIDEVLVTVMKAPKTFTMEDVVEINCHGGIQTTKKVLELLLINGCEEALPGEFTKRAFLNGRIDLIEAESVMDLINAKTEQSHALAINGLSGKVSNMIKNLRDDILDILTNIEVNIDYPEYDDIEQITNKKIFDKLEKIKTKMTKILKDSENGMLLKIGIKTAIIGKPNVGKSSLLNNLLENEKAIVTDIAGTTRDIIEGEININGLILNLIDTAGIRKTNDLIEEIGVNRSIKMIEESDLILYLLNNNEKLTDEDLELLNKIKQKNHIIIINKIDLENKLDTSLLNKENIVKISIKENIGIDSLKNKILELFNLNKIETKDMTYLTNARSISILKEALNMINELLNNDISNTLLDMLEIDIKKIWNLLGSITGEVYEDELIDQIFSRFCLGK